MHRMRKIASVLGLAAVMAVAMCSSAFAAIDYTVLTDGLTTKFEGGVTQVLPILGVILGAMLVVRTIKRFVKG